MRTLLMVVAFFFCLVLSAEGVGQINFGRFTVPPVEASWLDLSGKMPEGIGKAFFLDFGTEACLVIFVDESLGGEVRFSTAKGRKDVVILRRNGRVSYRNGANNGLVKPNDPVFRYCAERVQKASEFTPELKARFHGFAGIK